MGVHQNELQDPWYTLSVEWSWHLLYNSTIHGTYEVVQLKSAPIQYHYAYFEDQYSRNSAFLWYDVFLPLHVINSTNHCRIASKCTYGLSCGNS
jgi:hypothetical protein